jgi:2-polyprenyl-3-methyl-5-hydroxy-6-metoxy-1,4-benzoquinol methylase
VDDDAERHALKIVAVGDARAHYEEYWARDEPPPLGDPLTPRRLELLRPLLRAAGARRVLDAGAGAGDVVGSLAANGFDVVGLDISERALELARGRHPEATFLRHSVEELPWPVDAGSFEAVVAFDVIEHLLRPRALLEGARDALAPGGHLALSTPYHGLVKNLVLTVTRFDRHFDVEGDHIRFFSDGALRRLAEDAGFVLERLEHLGRMRLIWANSFVWLRRRD